MEVLQRNRMLYGLAPTAAMYPPAAAVHRMFVSPSDVYSCYTFEANTPSRTPTPERQQSGRASSSSSSSSPPSHHTKPASAAPMDISSSQTTTLHSVLRGEIPAAYSHLASAPSSSPHSHHQTSILSATLTSSPLTKSSSSSSRSLSSPSSSFLSQNNSNSVAGMEFESSTSSPSLSSSSLPRTLLRPAVPSPCPSHHSSVSYSPRPLSHESHSSQDSLSEIQTEPMDLSCKKLSSSSASRKRTAVSAFLDVATGKASSELLSSSLPAKFGSSSSSSSSSDFLPFPTSSSPSVTSMHSFPPSPADGNGGEEFSLLRNLLSVGKHNLTPPSGASGLSNSSPNLTSSSSDRTCDSPASDSFPIRTPVSGNTRVTLAKKNMLPVSARVSDWLVKIVQFAKSIPEFSTLSHNDKVTLVLNSWSRLMLLFMAESNFQFAVTPIPSSMDSSLSSSDSNPSQDEPTMKSVEGVQTFIKKCQQMAVDSKEYEFLRMLVLFNAGYVGLSCPESIDQLNSVVQQLLQQHVRVTRPADVMHYSRLLMCLPSLYGINSTMLEKFFCKQISRNTDMDVLLKELLQNVL